MKYYKFFILLITLLTYSNASAQDYKKGYILLHSGEKHVGFIKNFDSTSTDFVFRKNKSSKKIKYKSKDINEIGLFINKELGIYHNHRIAKYNKRCTKLKQDRRNCWAAQIYNSESIEAYQYYHRERSSFLFIRNYPLFFTYVDKDLKFAIKFPHIGYLIEIDEEDKGAKKLDSRKMKRRMIRYMSLHCDAFSESIEDHKDKLETFVDILEYYSKVCDQE